MTNIPKYIQVENYIIEKINLGELKIGEQIETEEDLVKRFGFSRMTINKALIKLAEKNYINRISGKGSFVKATHVTKSLEKHYSFTEDMQDIDLVAGSQLLSYELISSKEIPRIAQKMNIDENTPIHFFVRLRTGNEIPIAISYNYVSAAVLPNLSIDALQDSFYEYLRSLDYILLGNDVEIEATLPNEEQKKLLHIDSGAILKTKVLTGISFKGQESILGYFETFYNGNVYTYKFNK